MSDFLTAQFTGQPTLVALDSAAQFNALAAHLSGNADFARLTEATAHMGDDFWECEDWERAYRPYEVVDGILFVPVRGVLLHNFPYALGNWATGYEYIMRAVLRGLDDANVRGVALLCNSPGGMVAGCFEAADKIYERKGEKPIRAFAHEAAYSAAYAIASVADSIVVSKTGGVGSIGVVTSHIDLSKMYDEMGVKQTFIFAGKHKVDGNASEPLSDDVKARIQVRIDELYDVFVSNVARNRGMEEQAVRDTEALTYTATQAVSIGLADSIGPLDDAVAQFCADLSTPHGEENMTTPTTDAAVVEQAVHEQAVAAARAEGAVEATARIGAILGSEDAKGREDLANHFAFKTSMNAEDAIAALAVSPKAVAPAPVAETVEGGFDAAMSNGNPEIGGAPQGNGGNADADVAAETLALAKQLGLGFAK